jgi:sialate O-acetylesterase
VLIGEVWLCSGQSNMNMPLNEAHNARAERDAANYPGIRLFRTRWKASSQPQDDVEGQWQVCTTATAQHFSAAAYYFGRQVHQQLDVPVGLVHSSWGGTTAEAWTDLASLQSRPELTPILERFAKQLEEFPRKQAEYERAKSAYDAKHASTPAANRPEAPKPPVGNDHQAAPANLYNAMIHPLAPLSIRGVLWYQGESNASRAEQYQVLLPALIEGWRKRWGQGDVPFLVVQLANFRNRVAEPVQAGSEWAELREAQRLVALRVPNVGLAVAIDVGDAKDIHPKNKQAVGSRLASLAMQKVYGRDVVGAGPMFREMTIAGDTATLRFDEIGGGLVSRGEALAGFAIAGEDRVWHPAAATIDGASVQVRSDAVPRPVAVRYGWADNPLVTLYNAEGFPAVPFRSDDWPLQTAGKR